VFSWDWEWEGMGIVFFWNKFEHFGIIRFSVSCEQTDKQTDSIILSTLTDRVGVDNYDWK